MIPEDLLVLIGWLALGAFLVVAYVCVMSFFVYVTLLIWGAL